MLLKSSNLMLIVSSLVMISSVYGTSITGDSKAQLNDAVAITMINLTNSPLHTLSGFYIEQIYTNSANCSTSVSSYDANNTNFAVPAFNVAAGESTTINQQTLYNTFATSYVNNIGNFPSNTASMSVKIAAIYYIDYASQNYGSMAMKTDNSLNTEACFVLTCDSTAQTCTSSPSSAYY